MSGDVFSALDSMKETLPRPMAPTPSEKPIQDLDLKFASDAKPKVPETSQIQYAKVNDPDTVKKQTLNEFLNENFKKVENL